MLSPGYSDAGILDKVMRNSSSLLGGLGMGAQEGEESIPALQIVLNLFSNPHFFPLHHKPLLFSLWL